MQEYSKAERLELARRSRTEPPLFGGAERQRLSRELHDRLLARQTVRSHCCASRIARLTCGKPHLSTDSIFK